MGFLSRMVRGSIFFVMSIEEYKQQLKDHDWYYVMSDDDRIFNSGNDEYVELYRIAKENPEFMDAYKEEFYKHFPPKKLSD